MASWTEAYGQIAGATDPNQIRGMQFDPPSLWDVYGTKQSGRYNPEGIEAFKAQKIAELQSKEALPVSLEASRLNRMQVTDPYVGSPEGLKDFAERPSFWLQQDKPLDASNPLIGKTIEDFGNRAGNVGLTSNVLSNPTSQNVAQLIQTNPEHFASNMKNAASMLSTPNADTETPEANKFMQDALYVGETATSIEDFQSGMQDVLAAHPDVKTKTIQDFVKDMMTGVKEKLKPEKPERIPSAPHDMPLPGGWMQKMRYNPATGKDEPYGVKFKPTSQQALEIRQHNVNENSVSAEENAAIIRAIAEKRLDPYKVNSRNQKVLAQAAMNSPGINLNAIASELGLARNKDVMMKAGVAEMIPELLKETVQAGQKLNYSDTQFIGKIQKWKNGQLNDPKMVEYMTLRNDQLLTIGGVMRGNGMTDIAQRLEEEAAHPTMSPKALNGWLNGQLKSIDPRLSLYRGITKGNTAIPRSEYKPGTGIKGLMEGGKSESKPIAPAGTKVPKRGGGFYTSDGKGGWK